MYEKNYSGKNTELETSKTTFFSRKIHVAIKHYNYTECLLLIVTKRDDNERFYDCFLPSFSHLKNQRLLKLG